MYVIRLGSKLAQVQLDDVGYTTPGTEAAKYFVCVPFSTSTDVGVISIVNHPISSQNFISEGEALKFLKSLTSYQA